MSMEDFLFGSDLEDSDDEAKTTKENKESEREAQLNELFGDSPSEGEEEVELEHGESDKESDSGGEKVEERETPSQVGDDDEDESEVRMWSPWLRARL